MRLYQLFDVTLEMFNKYKKFILIFNGIVFLMIIIYLLLAPKWYVGRATMIITQTQQFSALNYLEGFIPGGLLPKFESNVDRYFVLAHSRRILDKVIEKFKLDSIYVHKFKEKLYRRVRRDIKLNLNEDGSITIECFYKENPYKAAEMANFMFEEIKRLNIEILNKQARDYRIFLENIYHQTIDDLYHVEDSLKNFQQSAGLYDIEEQVRQIIGILGELEIEKIKFESEKSFLEGIQHKKTNKISELENKIKAIETQIYKLENTDKYTTIPLNKIPEFGLTYLRLFRKLKIKEKILEFLIPELEHARLEEQKNTVNIYLLDEAFPQLHKAKPKRLKLLIVFMMVSIIFTTIIIRGLELLKGYKNQNRHQT